MTHSHAEPIQANTLAAEQTKARGVIKKYTLIAAGCGTIPVPIIDAAAVASLEIMMIDELAETYHRPFPGRLALIKALMSLIGSLGPIYLAHHSQSAVKGVPLVGHLISATLLSTTNAVAVYAVGRVFQLHFESGETLLSRDNQTLRRLFQRQQREGREQLPQLLASTAS
ncbi:DUF697 domain-containing protein [Ectothiorhodospiraceae bacterium BW-2]|nr:DUF697 domain-containing protein [Ectothiorhodospiraceae bacterium BW-2]